ncbi:tryptophan--tRNA ligase [Alloalcanivorax xenomutans]|jgi:tryptophanyl-tRNA synthetase|uniref:Tryptophan--tRNA ligase n=1 Tax=Alloalcanivorax xenomutans TaxID=1094342 RepID=A0A9Q3W447_9GAMM|nr:tryptophan--tRNA ligase [Alloalcanivorax xenomutans]ERS14183.1 tryptophanyl-tRNA synthetase [Alcanivorax sp. PN-3]MBA4723213.1 tryptophan--tRNA ligase [Alcanivorax sp.]ARB47385.1 tryptophanyl-tRNA synthetase [Alloalcanivorax xenomutans]MCE7508174.1 tryptophan--tRNA ligase [Alloalcanivorax xenomutans]MCE7523428.1 tryptophan--tRNA ligase [Alloalcanivorax xenomutans]
MTDKILTGDRPTGQLHLGHYVGSLRARVELQNQHPQTILIADMQGLTDNGHNPAKVAENILNVLADYLAVGIDPQRTTLCLQSGLPALAELTQFYANLVTVSRLERNPTVKAEIASKEFGASIPAGFLTYPISQAADITAFRATLVPVGDDQLPMIEQTNEVVRKVNNVAGQELLVECRALIGKASRLPGVDGKAKMSKSLGNALVLGASEKDISKAVKKMYTDPGHLRIEDPGKVEGNVVFTYLDAFHPDEALVAGLKEHYQRGGLGDGQVKKVLEECLQELLAPIRERRERFIADKGELMRILQAGTQAAREETGVVLQDLKKAFGLPIL